MNKLPSAMLRGIFAVFLIFSFSVSLASAEVWTEDGSISTIYPTNYTYGVALGTSSALGYDLNAQANRDHDNFVFRGYGGLSGERDIFIIYDNDSQGDFQDESSVFKILRARAFNNNADGATLAELTFEGVLPTVEDRQFYMLGRGGIGANEGPVSWGISANDSDFWTIGDVHGGATGIDCGTTGTACFNSPTYELSASGDSYINGGNLGIGNTSPTEALDVTGNVVASGTICDSTGCIGSGSGGTSVWTIAGSDTYYDTGNVGIGNASPVAGLDVISDDGALFAGTYGSGLIPATGAGTRMMWYPGKAAFRSGSVDSTQWDDGNIGTYSTAMGSNVTASANASTAIGHTLTASGVGSLAMGYESEASGSISVAIGNSNIASGNYALALGSSADAIGESSVAIGNGEASGYAALAAGADVAASGDYATVMGQKQIAQAYNSFLVGAYGNGAGTPDSWVSTDPLFVVGNGTSSSALNNALTVYKDGNAELDGDFTATGTICDSTGCLGSGSGSSGASLTGLTSGYVPYYDGSNLSNSTIESNPSIYSTTIGYNNDAVGDYSTALGSLTYASGDYSTTMGYNTMATYTGATAIGYNSTAGGQTSLAVGYNATASANHSVAIGKDTVASSNYALALVRDSEANGDQSVAMGYNSIVDGDNSVGIGYDVDITGDNAVGLGSRLDLQSYNTVVVGRYNEALGSNSWVDTDPLFVVANGSSSSDRNDAFTVLKDGTLEVDGDITSDGEICIGSGC